MLTEAEVNKKLSRKRKLPKQRELVNIPKRKQKTDENESNFEFTETPDEPTETIEDVDPPVSIPISTETIDAATNACFVTQTMSTQTESDKLAVAGRIQNIVLKNEIALLKTGSGDGTMSSQSQNPMDMNFILKSEKKTKYFIGLSPKHFWFLYEFLGEAKFNLTYWNSTKNSKKNESLSRNFSLSIANQLFITLVQ